MLGRDKQSQEKGPGANQKPEHDATKKLFGCFSLQQKLDEVKGCEDKYHFNRVVFTKAKKTRKAASPR